METPAGPVHNWPPFTEYNPGIGQLSGTPAGFFTNGNVYCHAASFKIAADFEAGRNDKAFETLKRILPSADKSEPYAQANGYVGPAAQRMALHVSDDPWRTGTVAWNFLNTVDQLFGFRRTLKGFSLRPKLPSHWAEARITRPFRGTNYEIHIRRGTNPRIVVDGKVLEGELIVGAKNSGKVIVYCEIPFASMETGIGSAGQTGQPARVAFQQECKLEAPDSERLAAAR
jgi:cellobiose phosphorylase